MVTVTQFGMFIEHGFPFLFGVSLEEKLVRAVELLAVVSAAIKFGPPF